MFRRALFASPLKVPLMGPLLTRIGNVFPVAAEKPGAALSVGPAVRSSEPEMFS